MKRNCNGPSFVVYGEDSGDAGRDVWRCLHCGASTTEIKGAVPQFRRKIEP